MIYKIPEGNIEKLEKQLKHIDNKAPGIIKYEILDYTKVKINDFYIPCVIIDIEGKYIINNWEFIATIDHSLPKNNIILSVRDDLDIPERYKNCGPKCEHCHRIRNRKDTYLVRNIETGEFKQVGKQCVAEYTNGLDSQVIAELVTRLREVRNMNIDENDKEFRRRMLSPENFEVKNKDFKLKALYQIHRYGYVPTNMGNNSTVNRIYSEYINLPKADESELEIVDKYVESLPEGKIGDWSYNLKLAWGLEFIRSRYAGLIASAINSYFKNIEKIKARDAFNSNTSFVGKIGDKITIKVKSKRVLFTNYYTYGYNKSTETYIYNIIGEDDKVYVWNTYKSIHEGDTITATIKDHKDYKGQKETIITRGKII